MIAPVTPVPAPSTASMAIQVLIPTPLQKFTNDEASVSLEATSIDGLLQALEGRYPGIQARLCDENGKLRRFLNLYVNSEDIRFLDNQATVLSDGDEVSIVPAVAGG
ncbi:MoaD/ThiS family protein [Cyanobium gracile]